MTTKNLTHHKFGAYTSRSNYIQMNYKWMNKIPLSFVRMEINLNDQFFISYESRRENQFNLKINWIILIPNEYFSSK